MVNLSKTNDRIKRMLSIVASGKLGDESYVAVLLFNINRFKNVIKKSTTLADWKRSPNGNNPHTFVKWTPLDEAVVCENRKTIPNEYMFMRKIGTAFPDDVLLEHTR